MIAWGLEQSFEKHITIIPNGMIENNDSIHKLIWMLVDLPGPQRVDSIWCGLRLFVGAVDGVKEYVLRLTCDFTLSEDVEAGVSGPTTQIARESIRPAICRSTPPPPFFLCVSRKCVEDEFDVIRPVVCRHPPTNARRVCPEGNRIMDALQTPTRVELGGK